MTTLVLDVVIPGPPVGKGRPVASTRGGLVSMRTPAKTAHWEGAAAAMMRELYKGPVINEPCSLSVVAVGARPKSLMRKRDPPGRMLRTTKPDGDNVLKAAADSLVLAGVLRDDVLIVDWRCSCVYAAKDEGPSVSLLLSTLAPDDAPGTRAA